MTILVRIEPDSTRDDILEALANYNAKAKRISRSGRGAQASDHYRDLHDTISYLTDGVRMFDSLPV